MTSTVVACVLLNLPVQGVSLLKPMRSPSPFTVLVVLFPVNVIPNCRLFPSCASTYECQKRSENPAS
jgi:hypothetical protein